MGNSLSPRRLALCIAAVAVLVVTGCGSQVDPLLAQRANGGQPVGSLAGPGGTSVQQPGEVTSPGDDAGSAGSAGGTGSVATSRAGAGAGSKEAASGGVDAPAVAAGEAGSCDGFKNTTGIDDESITIGNVADISGPIPGLFESAQQAVQAYVEFFNKTQPEGICGRSLELVGYDSRSDAGADQQAYAAACDETFATVGSISAFDAGGGPTADECGLPDMRGIIVTPERASCASCFSTYVVKTNLVPRALPDFIADSFPEAPKDFAVIYLNIGAAKINGESAVKAYEEAGYDVKYVQGIDVSEFNYAPYAQKIKDQGIKGVQLYGSVDLAVKLQRALSQQGYRPDVVVSGLDLYASEYVEQVGADGDGTVSFTPTTDMAGNSAELATYRQWLAQVDASANPTVWGLFAWSAARLFVEEAVRLGGALSRESLVEAFAGVRGWTGNGLHTAMSVGSGETAPCLNFFQLADGRYSAMNSKFVCGQMIDTGVGAS